MNDDLQLLASAYLDGDITVDERARVEGDPELLAEVERLRAVRALLAQPDEPKISVREAHLAAALDAWDRLPEAERSGQPRDTTSSGAGVTSMRSRSTRRDRRRVNQRWLTGAAAALVLVAGAGMVIRFGLAGSDDAADSSEPAAVQSASDGDDAEPAQLGDEADAGDESANDIAAALEESGLDGDASRDAGGDEAEAVELDTAIADPPPPPEDAALVTLRNPEDLAAFAEPALRAPVAPDGPAATSAPAADDDLLTQPIVDELPLCLGADVVVGPALYGDTLVVVGIDTGRNLALAYLSENCNEIARASLDGP